MKAEQAKKELIKTSIICVVVVIITVAIYIFVSGIRTEKDEELMQVSSQVSANNSQFMVINNRVNSINEAFKFYLDFKKDGSAEESSFRREHASKILSKIGNDQGMGKILLAMDQFREVGGEFKKQIMSLYVSQVNLQISAYTDVAVYNLIKKIEDNFPGKVSIKKFEIKRNEAISDDYLIKLSEGNAAPIVSANLTFDWGAIQEIKVPQNNNQNGNNPNSGAPGMPPGMGGPQGLPPGVPRPPGLGGGPGAPGM